MSSEYNIYNVEPKFRDYLLADNVSPITLKNYLSDLRHFLGWIQSETNYSSELSTSEIEGKHFIRYLEYLVHNGIPKATVNRRMSTLRKFIQYCLTVKLLEQNPFDKKLVQPSIQDLERHNNLYSDKLNSIKLNLPRAGLKYITFGALIFMVVFLTSASLFKGKTTNTPFSIAAENSGRVLNFEGNLTDNLGNPVITKTDVTFKLYPSEQGGNALYTGQCISSDALTPNIHGLFNATIGKDCGMKKISSDIFTNYPNLYLGITVGSDPEMKPRQKIANVGTASVAQTLQGLAIGTGVNSIPFINKAGILTIAASSPAIESTSGTFTLKGESVSLSTPSTSAGNILLSPSNGNVLVTSGNVGIGTSFPSTFKLEVKGDIGPSIGYLYNLGSPLKPWGGIYAQQYLQNGYQVCDASGNCDSAGGWNIGTNSVSLATSADNVGIGTSSPIHKLSVEGSVAGKALMALWEKGDQDILVASNSASFPTTVFKITNGGNVKTAKGSLWMPLSNGVNALSVGSADNNSLVSFDTSNMRVGIGTTSPGYILDVQDASSKINSKNGYLTNGADYAEYIPNEEAISAHSLVGLDSVTGKVRTYQQGDTLIGIVSTGIGFVGNGNKQVEQDPSYTLVGLIGQLEYDPSQVNIRQGIAYTHDNRPIGTVLSNGKILLKGAGPYSNLGILLDDNGNIVADGLNQEGALVASQFNSLHSVAQSTGVNLAALTDSLALLTDKVSNSETRIATLEARSKNNQLDVYQGLLSNQSPDFTDYLNQLIPQVISNLSIKIIHVERLITDNISVREKITSPIVETDTLVASQEAIIGKLKTNHISPVSDNLIIDLNNSRTSTSSGNLASSNTGAVNDANKGSLAQLIIKGLENKTVVSINASGDATFSGTLTSQGVQTTNITSDSLQTQTATISGDLTARNVHAENIDNLSNNINQVQQMLGELRNQPVSSASSYDGISNSIQQLASSSASLAKVYLETPSPTMDDLTVMGTANLNKLNVVDTATIGNILVRDNSILGLSWNLDISSLSDVTFFNGNVSISKDGSLITQGQVVAQKGIQTSSIKPLDNANIDVNFSGPIESTAEAQKLAFNNSQGQEVASIDTLGTGTFKGINLEKYSAASTNSFIAAPDNFRKNGVYSPAFETQSYSAGSAMIPSQSPEVLIYNDSIKNGSLIYLTPTSQTSTPNLTIAEKKSCDVNELNCRPYFKVVSGQSVSTPTPFNWLIIN